MIAVRLTGGLGNQMFQYSAGRALADRLGSDLILDTRAFDSYTRHTGYALGAFDIRAKIADATQLLKWPDWQVKLGIRLPFIRPVIVGAYFESDFTYDAKLEQQQSDVYLVGYWQSERYFADIADCIRNDFLLPIFSAGPSATLLAIAHKENSVALHVRRGDYVSVSSAADLHGVCSAEYYGRAIEILRKLRTDCQFLVFSDDLEWARRELPLDSSTIFVGGTVQNPELDLALMRACKHHIIANSTFSWWGAWLGHSIDQIVVAPIPWFAKQKPDSRDLLVPSWLYISRT